jgi:uncharacterized protein with HEPN domain
MTRSIIERLTDIIESVELAISHATGLDAEAFAAANHQRDAALFRIAVIGEAASHLPAEIQALAPEIPWERVKGMRNHIIHGYWQIDFVIVAQTIAMDLEALEAAARRLIALVGRADA